MYLPNFITIARIFAVPLIIWLIVSDEFFAAFVVSLLAGVSDALDGFLARRFRWQTELGAYLDPIADKMMLTSVYAALAFHNHVPAWLGIVVVSRDVLIVGAVVLAWLLNRRMEIRPLLIGKINTGLLIVLATLVLANRGLGLGWGTYLVPLVWAAGAVTMLSAFIYLLTWLRHMASYDLGRPLAQPAPPAGAVLQRRKERDDIAARL